MAAASAHREVRKNGSRGRLRIIFECAAAVGLLIFSLVLKADLAERSDITESVAEELNIEQAEIKKLMIKCEESYSPEQIETYSRQQLGMVPQVTVPVVNIDTTEMFSED